MPFIPVAIMIGAILYIISTVLTYTTFFSETVPAISRLEKRRGTLEEGVKNEVQLATAMEDQVEQETTYLSKLKVDIGEVKQELKVVKKKPMSLNIWFIRRASCSRAKVKTQSNIKDCRSC